MAACKAMLQLAINKTALYKLAIDKLVVMVWYNGYLTFPLPSCHSSGLRNHDWIAYREASRLIEGEHEEGYVVRRKTTSVSPLSEDAWAT